MDQIHSTETAVDSGQSQHSRRDVVRRGIKLAFIVPVISTFFAKDASAAASISCHSAGNACANDADCCGALTCNVADQCE